MERINTRRIYYNEGITEMKTKEPKFDCGKYLINWRMDYIKKWLKETHPSLACDFRKTNCGGYDVWIHLNSYISDDEILCHIQMPEYMEDSRQVIGKAIMMKGVHSFTAPVMCERIEKYIKKTGNYNALSFLDSIVKKAGKYY